MSREQYVVTFKGGRTVKVYATSSEQAIRLIGKPAGSILEYLQGARCQEEVESVAIVR